MTILGSLGAVTPASQPGDAADVTLTPDAETLALFASLFAMIQPQARPAEGGLSTEPQARPAEGGDPAAVLAANPQMTEALPAAAMLIAGAGQTDSREIDDQALADMAPLSHLLTVAKTMTGAENAPHIPVETPADDDLGEQVPDVTTAKAILVRAIEILDDINSAQPDAQGSDIQPAPVAVAMGSQRKPDMTSDVSVPAAPVRMVAEAAPSPDFIGPMPATPVRMVAEAAPSPDFIGPMPATPVRMVAEAPKPVESSRTAPFLTADGAPRSVVPPTVTPPTVTPPPSTGLSGEVNRPAAPEEALARAVEQDDATTGTEPRPDRQTSLKERFGQDSQRIMAKPEAGFEKVPRMPASSGPEATQAPVVSAREMRATMDQPATNNGQSSSTISTSTSQAAAGGGQSGSQGQSGHQSGQGGGQAASHYAADPTPSRDVADRTMLHRLNTANAGWSETMIKRLTSDLRSGVQNVRIILEPRNLGRLNVDLGLRDGKASIRIAAETVEAANLLAGARGQLSQMLEQSGMRLAGFQTNAAGQEAQGDTGGGQQGHAQQESGGKNTGRNGAFSNTMAEAEGGLRQDDGAEDDQELALRQGETAVLSVLA